MLRPGFGPGSPTREAGILDRTILPELGKDGSLLEINTFCTLKTKWQKLVEVEPNAMFLLV